jgi:hypothetical protein
MYEIAISVPKSKEIDTVTLAYEIESWLQDFEAENLIFETIYTALNFKNLLLEEFPYVKIDIINLLHKRRNG